ncbi:VanW family protein [filamentous cyanobacterium LEGE 11480]|uniref:VanW family protein n=1 Tax=Romeriopsis navalis LEGE 11480 TaxID=2777977 RepID=A0A928Z479_9CYAN|nr:VanW family protein [Romeriopsis navalis]MBE9030048.1 VanW family protein [Romeriopsis navalis LEGE 11480]
MLAIHPAIKRELRTCLTYGETLLKGYPFCYGRQQDMTQAGCYTYPWSEFVTPIPHRPGAEQINADRLWNLQQAAQHIHGLILLPGQLFGFWNRVPKPTLRNGFRAGPAFKRGKVTTDVGGGLCLISTNVFNALLLAGCEILERHHHSMDPYGERRFFPLGRDAMVYHGYRDLIARNATAIPVQLRLEVLPELGIVRSSLWGNAPCPVLVKLDARITATIPAQITGQMSGYQALAQRWVLPMTSNNPETAAWLQDYSTISSYEPCAPYYRENEVAVSQADLVATSVTT